MARKKKKKKARRAATRKAPKGTTWRTHFGKTAKACFREGPTSGTKFGECMKDNL